MWRLIGLAVCGLLTSVALADEVKDLDAFLVEVRAHGHLNVPPEHGQFLQQTVEMSGAKRVLEVGTSNGYSGLWIARGLRRTGGKLDTIEIDPGRAATARENFQKAGCAEIVTVHLGDALKLLPQLDGQYDMIFLDAGNFLPFFQAASPKLRLGGVLLSHNAILLRAETQPMLDAMKADAQWLSSVVQIGSDGFAVCHKRLAAPSATAAELDLASLVTDSERISWEKSAWGSLKWICNGKLSPGALQTMGLSLIPPGMHNPVHYHPNCEEVLYVLTGQGRHSVDGRLVDLKAGMTIRIPAGVKHNLTNTGSEQMTCIMSFSSGNRQSVFLDAPPK